MGILDRFKKKETKIEERPKAKQSGGTLGIEMCSGMRVEVTAQDGRLLFIAKLRNIHGYTAELEQYSEAELSPETEFIQVKIRGYDDHEKRAVYMEGIIAPLPKHVWRVENLTLIRVGNDRAFFRLDTNLEATITTLSGLGAGERSCRLLNISVGGACIVSEHRYQMGDKFLLKVRLLEDRPPSVMYCQVLRVTERDQAKTEYGCSFLELNEADQDRIVQNIFTAQRRQKKGSRT